MKKILSIVLIGCVFISGIFAEWNIGDYTDEFGDSIGDHFIYYIPSDGKMSNSATINSPAKVRIIMNIYQKSSELSLPEISIEFECHDYDWDNPIEDRDMRDYNYNDLSDKYTWLFKTDEGLKVSEHPNSSFSWYRFIDATAIKILNTMVSTNRTRVIFKGEGDTYSFSIPTDNLKNAIISLGIEKGYTEEEISLIFNISKYANFKLETDLLSYYSRLDSAPAYLSSSFYIDTFIKEYGEEKFKEASALFREKYSINYLYRTYGVGNIEADKNTFTKLGYDEIEIKYPELSADLAHKKDFEEKEAERIRKEAEAAARKQAEEEARIVREREIEAERIEREKLEEAKRIEEERIRVAEEEARIAKEYQKKLNNMWSSKNVIFALKGSNIGFGNHGVGYDVNNVSNSDPIKFDWHYSYGAGVEFKYLIHGEMGPSIGVNYFYTSAALENKAINAIDLRFGWTGRIIKNEVFCIDPKLALSFVCDLTNGFELAGGGLSAGCDLDYYIGNFFLIFGPEFNILMFQKEIPAGIHKGTCVTMRSDLNINIGIGVAF